MKKLKKIFKYIRYFFEYLGVMIVFLLVRFLPHSALFVIAGIGGFFLYLIPPFSKLIKANLTVAFPEKDISELKRIARQNATNLVLTILEFLWFNGNEKRIKKYVSFTDHDKEVTAKNISSGKGSIWATPHIGNWEVAGFIFKLEADLPFAVVVRTMNNPLLNRLVNAGRMSEGTRVISAKGAIKNMMRALKDGFFIATLIDQNTKARDGGIFVDFFGLPVATSRAPALFARKLNVPVAVGGVVRKGNRYYSFSRELPKPTSEYSSDEELVQAIMGETEKIIRQYPEQYLWLYERWRYIPHDLLGERKKLYPYYAAEVTPRFYDNSAPKGSQFPKSPANS